MRDVNNLLSRLKGDEKLIASHILLIVNDSKDKEKVFYIDKIIKDLYTNRSSVFKVINKLGISEIVSIEKIRPKVYKIKPLCTASFRLAVKALEVEHNG